MLSFVSMDPCAVYIFILSLYVLFRHDFTVSTSLPNDDSCIKCEDSSARLVGSLKVALEVLFTDLFSFASGLSKSVPMCSVSSLDSYGASSNTFVFKGFSFFSFFFLIYSFSSFIRISFRASLIAWL